MTEAEAVALLQASGIADARREVARIKALGGGDFAALIRRRAAHEPFSHLSGIRAFWEHEFLVTADVLDPRPDTETLVEAALEVPFTRVLDLGAGSGCILLSLLAARGEATGLGVDLSGPALEVAKRNRARLGLEARAELQISDWFDQVSGQFDLIVSNPPYIDAQSYAALARTVRDYEPELALTPGPEGLEAYRIITAQAGAYLAPGGALMVEIGFDQAAPVSTLFKEGGFTQVSCRSDLNGKPRVISGIWPQ